MNIENIDIHEITIKLIRQIGFSECIKRQLKTIGDNNHDYHAYWSLLLDIGLTENKKLTYAEREELAFKVGLEIGEVRKNS